jgi:double-stranded uracil-DNA glycosylase
MTPQQVLQDLLRPNLKVVFCGTQAGTASARRGAYYAGRGNRFWPILKLTSLVPELKPEDFARLLEFGIGLTDLCKATFGPDSGLRRSHFDVGGFRRRIEENSPKIVAFTGKRAAVEVLDTASSQLEYGLQDRSIGRSRVFVLPSTSGMAIKYWDERHWFDLARSIHERA